MALKKLLVALTTTREIKGKQQRVRFEAGKVVDLTDDEMELLKKLEKSTGKLHFRTPVNEGGGKLVGADPEIVEVPDYEGQEVRMEDKNVNQLKAYLTFNSVEFKSSDNKDALLALAKQHEAGQLDSGNTDDDDGDNADDDDQDGGL